MRNKDRFFISGYLMPPRNEACFCDLRDSGLTHIYIDYTQDEEIRKKALDYCERFGIKAIVMCAWSRYDNPSYKAVTQNAGKYTCFDGVNGLDEPLVEEFAGIEREYAGFSEDFPRKTFYINLVNAGVPQKFISADESKPYPFMMERYAEFVRNIKFDKTVSMTIYPLMHDEEKTFLNPAHLKSFEYLSKCAKETGAELYFFVQTMPFRTTHRKPGEADIRFQVNCGLAFGAKGVQYFCYRTPDPNWEFSGEQYAMVKPDGERTDLYYAVKTVNAELGALASEYLPFEWSAAYSVKGKLAFTTTSFESFHKEKPLPDDITYYDCLYDSVIGAFEGENGRKALQIVNYTDPSHKRNNYIEFALKDRTECSVTVRGERRVIKALHGRFSLLLAPGDGAFITY